MKQFALLLALLCLLCWQHASAQSAQQGVNMVIFEVDKDLYTTWDQSRSNRFQTYILDEFAVTLNLAKTCPDTRPAFKLFSYGPREFRWVMWYVDSAGTPVSDQLFQDCSFIMQSEIGLVHTRLQSNSTVTGTGFKLFRIPTLSIEQRPTTCFNEKRDEGEPSTDCGHDACNIPCEQESYCYNSKDCVVECFANMCQYYSTASTNGVLTALVALIAVLITQVY